MSYQKLPAICIFASSIVFLITILVFQIVLGPESSPDGAPTVADRGAHLMENKSGYLAFWTAESLAMGVIAASAFVLAFRGSGPVGSSLGWSLFGTGSLANVAMYAFVMGAYFPAASVSADMPVHLEIATASAFAIFYIANAIAFTGAGLVFVSLLGAPDRPVPVWLSAIGAIAGFSVLVTAAFGLMTGTDTMMLMGPGALLGYILIGIVGLQIARKG